MRNIEAHGSRVYQMLSQGEWRNPGRAMTGESPVLSRCVAQSKSQKLAGMIFFFKYFFSELDESHLLVVICCNFAMYYWIGYLLCRVSCGSRGVAV